ncbi:MAG: GNAT family N-acetyltransferase [Vicinamibacterales bacterium]
MSIELPPTGAWTDPGLWLGWTPFSVALGNGLRMQVCRDIGDVDARQWDSILGPEDVLMSHAFVTACQVARIEDADFWHLLVSRGEDVVCAATLHRMPVSLDLLSSGLTRKAIDALKAGWPGFLRLPVLFCGLPVSCGRPCLKIPRAADVEESSAAVAAAMESVAAATSTPLLCLKEFDRDAIRRMDVFLSYGYFRAPSLPSCSIELRWSSFPAYLASLRSGYRRQIRSSLRTRRDGRLRVERLDHFSSRIDTVFALYQQTVSRAPHRLETLNCEFFRQLDTLGTAKGIVIELDGRTVGAAVMVAGSDVAIFLFAGLAEDRLPQWQVYQNLVAEVVAAAIDSGARRLELGQTSYDMKSRMGAREDPRFIYLRYRRALGHSILRGVAPALFPAYPYPARRVFAHQR